MLFRSETVGEARGVMSRAMAERPSRGQQAWAVTPDEAGVRLDKFLAPAGRCGSRGRAVDALDQGKVQVAGSEMHRADAARRLEAGEVVTLWADRPGSRHHRTRRVADLVIRYEDESLVVVDKPAGLLSVPLGRRRESGSVLDQLREHWQTHGGERPLVVHRIDRDRKSTRLTPVT